MRELKFRAWDGLIGEMFFFDLLKMVRQDYSWCATNKEDGTFDGYGIDLNDKDIMQYTGLKDKNGKEIYEDDCFELNYLTRWIEWDQENCCYNINTDEAERGQVTANKHENPELL